MDDLNYLLRRQQQERSYAVATESTAAKAVHNRMASLYEDRIRRLTNGRVSIAPLAPAHGGAA
jgi:hypothetical protein